MSGKLRAPATLQLPYKARSGPFLPTLVQRKADVQPAYSLFIILDEPPSPSLTLIICIITLCSYYILVIFSST